MSRAFVDRIKHVMSMVAIGAIALAVVVVEFGTQRMPEARAAADWQLKKEIARERVTCERWGMQEGSEKYAACLADLTEIRVKHDQRRANDPGNRRDALTIVF